MAKKKKKKELDHNPEFERVMEEFKHGELHSGSKKGPIVKNPRQAVAIAYSESRKSEEEEIVGKRANR